jgi:hypothetical protein
MSKAYDYDWEENFFWKELTKRIHLHEHESLSGISCRYDERNQAWCQETSRAGSTLPALLQNKYAVVDVTDRGLGLYPILLDGRYLIRVNFQINIGNTNWNTHEMSDINQQSGSEVERQMIFLPGAPSLLGVTKDELTYKVCTYLPQTAPLIVIEVAVNDKQLDELSITPEIILMSDRGSARAVDGFVWVQPSEFPSYDAIEIHNDSLAADPLRPSGLASAGVGFGLLEPTGGFCDFAQFKLVGEDAVIIADRQIQLNDLNQIVLPTQLIKTSCQTARLVLVLGLCDSPNSFYAEFNGWLALKTGGNLPGADYWNDVLKRLAISVPDPAIQRQIPSSIHNSLFSRSTTTGDRTLFLHGRRDRGYSDCAKIHQTYQLHLVALAANETASVREELISFAAVQDSDGGIPRQLSPRSGWHPYIGTYSNTNFLLAIYRYLSWTGDIAFLQEYVESEFEPGTHRTLLERALLAANWLLAHRWHGLVEPCGWVDAWAPGVKANAQASMTTAMGLRRLAEICECLGRQDDAIRLKQAGEQIETEIVRIFYNPITGLFAEYLYKDCSVAGGELNDFWSITQIWAVLTGLSCDTRGLDLTRQYCLKRGIVMNPEGVIQAAFLSQLQDTYDPLPLDRNAVWGLASWPELTHLYALAEINVGRPDLALATVAAALPETAHLINHYAPPFYFPEKYIHPLTTPWLCTWAGDPTMIQLLLEGFMGVKIDLFGITVKPCLPTAWKGINPLSANFYYRGSQMELSIESNEQVDDKVTLRQL